MEPMGILTFDQLLESSNCPVVVDFDLDNAWIGLFVRPDKAHKPQFFDRHRRMERCKELSTICEIRRHTSLSICHGQTELQVSLSNYSQRDDTTSSDLCDTATSWTRIHDSQVENRIAGALITPLFLHFCYSRDRRPKSLPPTVVHPTLHHENQVPMLVVQPLPRTFLVQTRVQSVHTDCSPGPYPIHLRVIQNPVPKLPLRISFQGPLQLAFYPVVLLSS